MNTHFQNFSQQANIGRVSENGFYLPPSAPMARPQLIGATTQCGAGNHLGHREAWQDAVAVPTGWPSTGGCTEAPTCQEGR